MLPSTATDSDLTDSRTDGGPHSSLGETLESQRVMRTVQLPKARMADRLETGISVLDRKLEGGLPPGSVVGFAASPASQSELLLYELTAARGTLYISTERSADAVHDAVHNSPAQVGNPTIRAITSSDPLAEAREFIEALPDGANLIVDTMDTLERTRTGHYVDFVNDLKARMVETGSIAVLHCLKGGDEPANRQRTLHAADAVFDLRTAVSGSDIENTLAIPKFRRGHQPTETIKLELTEEVAIDTSRDIA